MGKFICDLDERGVEEKLARFKSGSELAPTTEFADLFPRRRFRRIKGCNIQLANLADGLDHKPGMWLFDGHEGYIITEVIAM